MKNIVENMIAYAEGLLGSEKYGGWCLSFIEDCLEKGNGIEIHGGDCARESCEMYGAFLKKGEPERGSFVFYDCLCSCEGAVHNYGHCGISLGEGRVIHALGEVRIDGYLDIENAPMGEDLPKPKYIGWVSVEDVVKYLPLRLENKMWHAAADCDREAFMSVVAEDAVMVCGGHRCSGAEYGWLICEVGVAGYEIRDYELIYQSEELMQVRYIAEATAKRPEDADLAGLFQVTSSWEKREDGWKLVFNMDSRIRV